MHPAIGITERGEGGTASHEAGPPPSDIELEFTTGAIYPGAELYRWRVEVVELFAQAFEAE